MKTIYTFEVIIPDTGDKRENTLSWLESLVKEGQDVVYDFETAYGSCLTTVTVEEPSDFYVYMHNAKRRGLIEGYEVK